MAELWPVAGLEQPPENYETLKSGLSAMFQGPAEE